MSKNNISIIPDESIIDKIYLIRDQNVMIDRDLAVLYGVETKVLKQAVKRNSDIFPEHFMFELTVEEFQNLRSQIVTSSWGGQRYMPYVFTEHGVLQLANVLRSKRAKIMSIRIIEVFVRMRELLLSHKDILLKLEQMERQVSKNSEEIQTIFNALKQLINPLQEPRKRIGFR